MGDVRTEDNKLLVRRLVQDVVRERIFVVRDGKLVSALGVEDNLSRLRQLGILPQAE